MERTARNLEELETQAAEFVRSLDPVEWGATLVTLSGELGAGKTAFTKAVAKTLGIEESVTSPTFVLEKMYQLSGQKFERLIHIDAYRLEKGSDLQPLGFDELMENPKNLIFLEWPERVAHGLPVVSATLTFEVQPDDSRKITYA